MNIYYTVYKITNLLNGKIYIGQHKTSDLNDSYYGSGKLITKAIKKYGIENFKKEILHIFETEKESSNKEKELVTWEFCCRDDTYNMTEGGGYGWKYVNETLENGFKNKKHSKETIEKIKCSMDKTFGDPEFKAKQSETQKLIQNTLKEKIRNSKNQILAQNRTEVKIKKSDRMKELFKDENIKAKHKESCNTEYAILIRKLSNQNTKFLHLPNTTIKIKVKDYEVDYYLQAGYILGMGDRGMRDREIITY